MKGNEQFEMQCTEFDALLTEALDGLLEGERRVRFERHKAQCPACSLLFEETKSGFDWLHTLDEVEPPLNLVHNVIAATTGAEVGSTVAEPLPRKGRLAQWKERFLPRLSPVMTPRFAMSFGMAFFSVSMIMSVAGVRAGDLRHLDLTPKGIRKTLYETQARATRYYENIRFVYELESRVRQLKKAATTPAQENQESKPESNPNQSKEPDRREQNYSRHDQNQVMAELVRCRIDLRS